MYLLFNVLWIILLSDIRVCMFIASMCKDIHNTCIQQCLKTFAYTRKSTAIIIISVNLYV